MRQNGAAIRAIRELRKVKVRSMSEHLGCARWRVYRIEHELTDASDETLQSIACFLAVDVAAIRQREEGDMTTTATKPNRRTVKAVTPDPDSEGELQHYSRKKAASLLGVSEAYLYRLVRAGEISYTFRAGSYKFTAAHIREYSAKGEVKAKKAA